MVFFDVFLFKGYKAIRLRLHRLRQMVCLSSVEPMMIEESVREHRGQLKIYKN